MLTGKPGLLLKVAEGLQLRSRRRPPGFWDNEDALDRELSRFITAAWTQHRVDESDGNETYFYNQVFGAAAGIMRVVWHVELADHTNCQAHGLPWPMWLTVLPDETVGNQHWQLLSR